MHAIAAPLTEYQQEVLDLHLDPRHGSRYWLELAAKRGLKSGVASSLQELIDICGPMDAAALRDRPVMDFVPAVLHAERAELMVCETGGATGAPKTTVYRRDEFRAAFIEPFLQAALHTGFPQGGQWLWVGPSGPHIIGRAATLLAHEMGAASPFTVDFDPRWVRKLAPGSLARQRYLDHVIDQAARIAERETIDVLFTTPSVLARLAAIMTESQRAAVRGVHYGGQRLDRETLAGFQEESFPNAVHLAGYGNTLFGCCLELEVAPGRTPAYFPFGERLVFHSPDSDSPAYGQVRFSRFDKACMIIDMHERDEAKAVAAPANVPGGFAAAGLLDPRPIAAKSGAIDIGLY